MHKKLSAAKIHLAPKKQAPGNLPGENLGHNCPPASATPGFGGSAVTSGTCHCCDECGRAELAFGLNLGHLGCGLTFPTFADLQLHPAVTILASGKLAVCF